MLQGVYNWPASFPLFLMNPPFAKIMDELNGAGTFFYLFPPSATSKKISVSMAGSACIYKIPKKIYPEIYPRGLSMKAFFMMDKDFRL